MYVYIYPIKPTVNLKYYPYNNILNINIYIYSYIYISTIIDKVVYNHIYIIHIITIDTI